eukprot:m.18974 g.18974  ORF g.18974 m.18974 type:complete len:96 (+) comp8596_c0_seq1:207-494(+)
MLRTNRTLTELDLYYNDIDEAGAIALAEALKCNNTLLTLSLSRNNITDAGARAIVDALKVNQTLEYIDINYCRLSPESISLLENVRTGISVTAIH